MKIQNRLVRLIKVFKKAFKSRVNNNVAIVILN